MSNLVDFAGIDKSEKGQADGIATLDANAKVPAIELNIATNQNIIDKTAGALLDASMVAPDDIITVDSDVTLPTVNAVKNLVNNATPGTDIGEYKRRAVPYVSGVGWLLCDGQAVSRATYSLLFDVIGVNFGVGDGSTTFNLPNASGRVSVSGGAATGLTNRSVGDVFGEERITLTEQQIPSHNHSNNHNHNSATTSSNGSHTHNYEGYYSVTRGTGTTREVKSRTRISSDPNDYAGNSAGTHNHTLNLPNYVGQTGQTGGGQSHNNLQPSLVDGFLFIYASV